MTVLNYSAKTVANNYKYTANSLLLLDTFHISLTDITITYFFCNKSSAVWYIPRFSVIVIVISSTG